MAKEPELPIRIIRERGRVRRATATHEAAVRNIDRYHERNAQREVITHRVNEQSRGQQEHLSRRIQFRRVVTEESLRRRRTAVREQAGEKFGADVAQRTGARPAAVGVTAGIIRVFVVIFALSMLFLIVSRGDQAGNAVQQVGYFLNNLTSSQPLFRKKTA